MTKNYSKERFKNLKLQKFNIFQKYINNRDNKKFV